MESLPAVALDGEDHNQMDVDQPTKPLQKLPAPPPENPWRGAVSRVGAAAPNAVFSLPAVDGSAQSDGLGLINNNNNNRSQTDNTVV